MTCPVGGEFRLGDRNARCQWISRHRRGERAMTAAAVVAPAPVATAVRRGRVLRKIGGVAVGESTPAKLRLLLVGLLALVVLWTGVAVATVAARASATANVVGVSEPLSLDAEQIYRSLSDAD